MYPIKKGNLISVNESENLIPCVCGNLPLIQSVNDEYSGK